MPDPILHKSDVELQDWVNFVNLVINAGKYQFPIYSTQPGTSYNKEGESLIVSAGTARAVKWYINGLWCTVNFNSTAGAVTI